MRLDPNINAIILPVTVYGDAGFRIVDMVLDTGATFVSVPPSFAESLGYNPGRSTRQVRVYTADGVRSAPSITIQRIQALDVEAAEVEALCINLPGENRLRGLLGLSFLKHFDMDVHFRQGSLRIR